MNTFSKFIFFFCLSLLLSGCPYESEFPLGLSQESVIDTGLLGPWLPEEAEPGALSSLTFFRFNEHEYYVEILDDAKVERYRAYVTTIGDDRFLNYQDINAQSDKPVKYGFLKYTISGDNLRFQILEDALLKEKVTSSAELRKMVLKYIESKELFSDLGVLKRGHRESQQR